MYGSGCVKRLQVVTNRANLYISLSYGEPMSGCGRPSKRVKARGLGRGMRLLRTLVLGLGSAALLATACSAASIEPVQGQVSINRGKGFEPVNRRTEAKVGDSVMVSPDGAAVVAYADGCKVDVHPGAVMTIALLSPCASGSYAQDQTKNYTLPTVFGGTVLGVLGLAGYEISKSSSTTTPAPSSTPASP